MHTEQQLTSFILQSKVFGDADELLTVFSREHGKVRLLVKGARKPLSKLKPAVIVPSLSVLRIIRGNFDRLVGAKVLESGEYFFENSLAAICWYQASELVLRGLPEEQSNEVLFANFEVLWKLAKSVRTREQADFLSAWFAVRWLEASGFGLELPSEDIPCDFSDIYGKLVPSTRSVAEVDINLCRMLRFLQTFDDSLENVDTEYLALSKAAYIFLGKVITSQLGMNLKTLVVK